MFHSMSATNEMPTPDPDALLQEAESENPRRILGQYNTTITVLKESKKFTFREIAEWLSERGIPCDHNSVYREYIRHMDPVDVAHSTQEDDAIEEEEAIADAKLNGTYKVTSVSSQAASEAEKRDPQAPV
jgi:transposase